MKKRKYTSDEILDLFKGQHRLSSPLDPEAEPSIEIKMEMSIRDWRCAKRKKDFGTPSIFLTASTKSSAKKRVLVSVCDAIRAVSKSLTCE